MRPDILTDPPVETIDFGPLTIRFDDRVLRPRPWTAAQSTWAAELLADAPDGPVLELCTGAGQIGLLAAHTADRPIVLVDADPVACDYARTNADAAGLGRRTEVRCGRLETALAPDEAFALVIADPPWVPSTRTDQFPEDPLTAIDGGSDGLDIARSCLRVAAEHLRGGGSVILQVGTTEQADALTAWLAEEPQRRLEVVEVRDHPGSGTLLRADRVRA